MRSWNAHAWYCIGILLALLIGTVSVKWNTVDRLPEIIAFALGLSSLLLAIFTIVQSLSTGNDAAATLASVREAAMDMRSTATGITEAAADLKSLSGSMLQSSEAGREAISELKEELAAKSRSASEESTDKQQAGSKSTRPKLGRLSFGGAGALYSAIRSFQNKKPLNMGEVFPGENVAYEDGFLAGLKASGFLDYKTVGDDDVIVTDVYMDTDDLLNELLKRTFRKQSSLGTIESRYARVDSHFGSRAETKSDGSGGS